MKNYFLLIVAHSFCASWSLSFLFPDPVAGRFHDRIVTTTTISTTTLPFLLVPSSLFPPLFAESYTRSTTAGRRKRGSSRLSSPEKEHSQSRRFAPIGIWFSLLDTLISMVAWPLATLLAKIIEHPPVRRALGQCIVCGFKDICMDEDLDYYLDSALRSVNEDLERDARKAGQAFPSVVKQFVLGMVGRSYVEEEEDYGDRE